MSILKNLNVLNHKKKKKSEKEAIKILGEHDVNELKWKGILKRGISVSKSHESNLNWVLKSFRKTMENIINSVCGVMGTNLMFLKFMKEI